MSSDDFSADMELNGGTFMVGDFQISGGTPGEDYRYEAGVLTVLTGRKLLIRNNDPDTPTEDTILIADGVDAYLTLGGVNIDVSRTGCYKNDHELLPVVPGYGIIAPACIPGKAALRIADNSGGNVTIRLHPGTKNILQSGCAHAGVEKCGKCTGTLTVTGAGSLIAKGGEYAAGIGGGSDLLTPGDTENITINGSVRITATGTQGAGIGGGNDGDGLNIAINSGIVTAISSEGAGIGGGGLYCRGGSAEVTINGGIISAYSAYLGWGIGVGCGGLESHVTINNGVVTTSGLGGGKEHIVINGGTVTEIEPEERWETGPTNAGPDEPPF